MTFPRIHPIRLARRNAADAPTLTIASKGDFIKMRIDQMTQFRKIRGSFKTPKRIPTIAPYANGAPPFRSIPRTTNADIRAVVRSWDQAFRAYKVRDQRLGGSHNKAFELTHRRRWENTRRLVQQLTAGQPDRDEFAQNAAFWAVWLPDLAVYLSDRQHGQPARMQVIIDVITEAAEELPDTLVDVAGAAVEGVIDGAKDAADQAGKGWDWLTRWLKWGALAGAGLLVAPPLLSAWRRSRPPERPS